MSDVRTVSTILRSILRSLPTLAILMALAWVLWPASLGGWATFTVVQGTSMEPTYQNGDMLYGRSVDSLTVGPAEIDDVVVYRIADGEPGAGRHVVHRIAEVRDDGTERQFVLVGDNRTNADQFRPTTDDLVSKPLVNLGPWPTRLYLAIPLALAAVIGLSIIWFLWPAKVIDAPADERSPSDEPGETPVDEPPIPSAENLRSDEEPADVGV